MKQSTMLVLSQSTMFVQTCRVLFNVRQSYICKGPPSCTTEKFNTAKILLGVDISVCGFLAPVQKAVSCSQCSLFLLQWGCYNRQYIQFRVSYNSFKVLQSPRYHLKLMIYDLSNMRVKIDRPLGFGNERCQRVCFV